MDFCNKMDFLMKLTQIQNKELAAEMTVDRSLISLLRTGKRGVPQNSLHIKRMADSFSKRITTGYQRQALAEISGIPSFRTALSSEIIATQLERWLMGKTYIVEHILEGMEQAAYSDEELSVPSSYARTEETVLFYGDSGKLEALRYFLNTANGDSVGILDNTDLSWAYSDPSFTAELFAFTKTRLTDKIHFTQILPPISNINQYTDSLRFLLPIYTRTDANVYYYPRMIDIPQNMTLIVVPEQCVLYSYSLSSGGNNAVTIVSSEKEFVSANEEQFSEYLALCKSALRVHKEPEKFPPIYLDFLEMQGDICQKTMPLSTLSMSVELVGIFSKQFKDPLWKRSFNRFIKKLPLVEQHFSAHTHIDICPLNSVKEIAEGKVPVASPYMPDDSHICYTPETYILHLENILRLMDTYKGYFFIPLNPKIYQGYNLLVNEGGKALLSNGLKISPMVMEFRRPEIVMACKEHLMRIVDAEGGLEGSKKRARAEICELISDLQKVIKKRESQGSVKNQ